LACYNKIITLLHEQPSYKNRKLQGSAASKSFIQHASLENEVRIDLTDEGRYSIKPIRSSREEVGGRSLRRRHENNPPLELEDFGNDFDKNEWEWK